MTANWWHGVDLDGTLAKYDGWQGPEHIGEPVPQMVRRVKTWLAAGEQVRIVTARVSVPEQEQVARRHIQAWCLVHIGVELPVTDRKDFGMIDLWDDRAVRVEKNTGRRMDNEPDDIGGPA